MYLVSSATRTGIADAFSSWKIVESTYYEKRKQQTRYH